MRKTLLMIVLGLAVVAVASAGPMDPCMNYLTPVGSSVNVLADNFACTMGGLTFSNFSASAAGFPAGYTPIIWLAGGIGGNKTGVDPNTGVVNLYFQTNFNPVMDVTRDITFTYTVDGVVVGIDGWMGGQGSRLLSETLTVADPNNAGQKIQAGALVLNVADSFTASSPVTGAPPYTVLKDIQMNGTATTPAGTTEFSQSYVATCPEPITFVLIGSGLLALGLIRRVRS